MISFYSIHFKLKKYKIIDSERISYTIFFAINQNACYINRVFLSKVQSFNVKKAAEFFSNMLLCTYFLSSQIFCENIKCFEDHFIATK